MGAKHNDLTVPPSMRILLLVLLLLPAATPAQGAGEAARAFLAARARRDWAGMAEFADGAGRLAIRAAANRAIEQLAMLQRPEVRQTLEAARASAPLRLLDAGSSMIGGGSLLRLSFAGVSDPDSLRSLSDGELVARWFQAKDPGYLTSLMMNGMMSEIIAKAPDSDRLRAGVDSVMQLPTGWAIVGVVEERSVRPVAHVIYRMTTGGPTGVLTFRENAGRWYLASLDPSEQVDQMSKLDLAARQLNRPR
jgi:hypothetical protein